MKTPFMHRRHFLQAVSGAALAFPWFSGLALQGADASKAPRRLVCIGMDFGVRPESFFPTGQGTNQQERHGNHQQERQGNHQQEMHGNHQQERQGITNRKGRGITNRKGRGITN